MKSNELLQQTRIKYTEAGAPNHLSALLFSLISGKIRDKDSNVINTLEKYRKPPRIVQKINENQENALALAFHIVLNFLKEAEMSLSLETIRNEFGQQQLAFYEEKNSKLNHYEDQPASDMIQYFVDQKERFEQESSDETSPTVSLHGSYKESLDSSARNNLYNSVRTLNPLMCSGYSNKVGVSVFALENDEEEEIPFGDDIFSDDL